MKKILIFLTLIIMFAGLGQAAEVTDAGIGARSMGMGGVEAAFSNDAASSVFGNAANLTTIQTAEIISLSSSLTGDVNYSLLGLAWPMMFGKISLGYAGNRIGGISTTSLDATSRLIAVSTINYGDDLFVLGFGNRFNNNLSYGAKLKYMQRGSSDIANAMGFGTNLDLGLLYQLDDGREIGVEAVNVIRGSSGVMRWGTGYNESIPWGVKAGLGVKGDGYRFFGEYAYSRNEPSKLKIGYEYLLNPRLALRLGLVNVSLASNERYSNYTGGLGFILGNFKVDYAYENNGLLSYNSRHYISLSVVLHGGKPFRPITTITSKEAEKDEGLDEFMAGYYLGKEEEQEEEDAKEYKVEAKSVAVKKPASEELPVKKVQKAKPVLSAPKAVRKPTPPIPSPKPFKKETKPIEHDNAAVNEVEAELKLGKKVLVIAASFVAAAVVGLFSWLALKKK